MRLISHSVIGARHLAEGREDEDFVLCDGNASREIVLLADGVSSCAAGGRGARLVCERLRDWLLSAPDDLLDRSPERLKHDVLSAALAALSEDAERSGIAVAEYASTLCLALVDKRDDRALVLQLGDSLVYIEQGGRLTLRLGDASEGTVTVCTTTEDAHLAATVRILLPHEYDSITLFSDGAWRPIYRDRERFASTLALLSSRDGEAIARALEQAGDEDDASMAALYRI